MSARKVGCKDCGEHFTSRAKLTVHQKKAHTSGGSNDDRSNQESGPTKRVTRLSVAKKASEVISTVPATSTPTRALGKKKASTAKVSTDNSKVAKGSPKVSKETSKVSKETPKVSKDNAKVVKDNAKVVKDNAKQKQQQEPLLLPTPTLTPATKAFESNYICHLCSKNFVSQVVLNLHQTTCISQTADVVKTEVTVSATAADDDIEIDAGEDNGEVVDDVSNVNLKDRMKGKLVSRARSLLRETYERGTEAEPDSGKGWLACDKCPKMFKLKATLHRHKKVVHMEGASHRCDVCGTRCADKGTLARHMYIHTGLKPYQCEECKKQFSRKYHLFRHMHQTNCGGTPLPSFPCQVCGKMFSRNDNLREHLRIHAGDRGRTSKKHKCDFCKKDFHSPSMLRIHERVHTGERPYQCKVCEKAFPSDNALKKHTRVHTGERPYECEECAARFSLPGTLKRHQRTHSGVRPHKCQHCEKAFIQLGSLKAHLFHHTGENGFPCDECGKAFNRRARLLMHKRYMHDKVRAYSCDRCEKAFVRKEDRDRHLVLHTGVKAYACPTCNKTFAIKPSLKLHLLTHTREEPKSCSECGRAFIRQDCLVRHLRKRHREIYEKLYMGERKQVVLPASIATVAVAPITRPMAKHTLSENIRELLSLLVDEATLKAFGWPDKPVVELLESVIRRCGHTPVDAADYSPMDRLRENCKLLFTVVIDDTAVKTLLNNHTVDEVILHVLRLAKT